MTQQAAHVAEVLGFAAIHIFAHAAGEHHALDLPQIGQGIGQKQVFDSLPDRTPAHCCQQGLGHPLCHLRHLRFAGGVPGLPLEARFAGMVLAGRIQAHDFARFIHHQQTAADMQGSGRLDLAAFDNGQLGGAAADINIEDPFAGLVRGARRARAIRCQHGFHVMACGGADELTALFGQDRRDRLRVLAPQRLTGQDHGTGVNVVGMQAGALVGLIDNGAQRRFINTGLALIRCECNRRLIQRLARDHEIAAGEVFPHAPQFNARKNHLGTAGANINPHAHQRDMILLPHRVIFQIAFGQFKVIMIMVGIFAVFMNMVEFLTILMVADIVAALC